MKNWNWRLSLLSGITAVALISEADLLHGTVRAVAIAVTAGIALALARDRRAA